MPDSKERLGAHAASSRYARRFQVTRLGAGDLRLDGSSPHTTIDAGEMVKWCNAWGKGSRVAVTGPPKPETASPIGTKSSSLRFPALRHSSTIRASRMAAASSPPNVDRNTVMATNSYSGGTSLSSSSMVPVRLVARRM